MSLSATFNSNHPKTPKIATAVLLTTCTLLAGKIILFDLSPELRIPALVSVLAPAGALALKIDEITSENEQLLGGALLLTGGNMVVSWAGFPDSQVSHGKVNKTVSIFETLSKHRFFFDRLRDKESQLNVISKQWNSNSPVLRELVEHLKQESTQDQLKRLSKEACNHAIDLTSDKFLKTLGLQDQDTIYQFYTDVYFYLRVWLKNSIEYDTEMPDIGRSIKDASIYLKAFKFLRNERVDYFLSPGDQFSSSPEKLMKPIELYLECLIDKLDAEHLNQGLFGRLFKSRR